MKDLASMVIAGCPDQNFSSTLSLPKALNNPNVNLIVILKRYSSLDKGNNPL